MEKKRTAIFLAVWLFGLGMMAFQIEKCIFDPMIGSASKDPLYLLLGSAKEAIGDTFFLKANSYFHGGVSTDLIQDESIVESKGQDAEGLETFKKAYTDWVYKINSQIKVMEHRHLQGEGTKEILPFLEAAVKLDPYNVPAILTTAFWLNDYFKKADAATDILKQGLKDNPESWEICYHLGLNYFKYKKNYSESALYFERSLEKMDRNNSNEIDHRGATYYLAESYAKQGLSRQALETYQKALTYFGEKENPPVKSAIIRQIKNFSDGHVQTGS